ncbi:class I adenylate-forming enzyme family protein [Roseibium suaedae]|uniref:Acyl-coenzyme A synthetase/AMP-(Fatty) acid ligase n=1 Tax=Roseibium suaedae TaxID=735517 RepID=A0A1M7MRN6_9HYPH|nr:AMP-binding protein [Roseibium suaedae]SHM93740.1 Acyl-coenzyme A synthetase/AMP-(fatty) acid ligase [Roseibium suaedae]
MNLARYCLTNASPSKEAVALEVVGLGGALLERWTYGEVEAMVLRIAAGFAAAGLSRGDRVLLRLGHSSDFPFLYFGAIAGGFVPIPSSDMLTASEAGALLADSGAAAVVHDGRTVLPDGAYLALGPEDIAAMKAGEPGGYAQTSAEDPAFLVYTSGTSGTPKGVLHAHRTAAGRAPMYLGWYGISSADRLLHAGAFNWTYTLGVGLMDPWANGAVSIVYDGPRDPEVWPDLIEASGATLFAAVPSLYRRILKYGKVGRESFPALRHGLTAGEALPAELYLAWKEVTGRELYEALGMSEISTYVSSGPGVAPRPGSPGKPQAGRKVAVLSETQTNGAVLAPQGEAGLLAIHESEPGLMLGYWQRPQDTAEAFRDEWFLTGDRARFDADGYLWYEGRADDLMNAFGYRVAPQEVERCLSGHPQVAEVAVTALEMRPGVSLITAFVVPAEQGFQDADELARWALEHLAEYKRPKAYRFVPSLPRTPSGKVRRKALVSLT